MSENSQLIILGGNGAAGEYLMHHLAEANRTATVISRRPMNAPKGFTELLTDLNKDLAWAAPDGATVISFLPLWILTTFLPRLTKANALIATGSTSRFSKTNSGDAHERGVAEKLEHAEQELQKWSEEKGITWTVLRPTIIYDCKSDKNITRMARFIRRWHFLPLASPANGLRQPIHTDDVAKAAFLCIDNTAAANKAFNISGGEVLTYRAMVERVFLALGKPPRLLPLPTRFLQSCLRAVAKLGLLQSSNFSAEVFLRMNQDLVFEVADGLKAIKYQPRSFKPEFADHL